MRIKGNKKVEIALAVTAEETLAAPSKPNGSKHVPAENYVFNIGWPVSTGAFRGWHATRHERRVLACCLQQRDGRMLGGSKN